MELAFGYSIQGKKSNILIKKYLPKYKVAMKVYLDNKNVNNKHVLLAWVAFTSTLTPILVQLILAAIINIQNNNIKEEYYKKPIFI